MMIKSESGKSDIRLTMHVNLDGGGHGVADVVVAGLAGQDGVEVLSPEVVQQQGVDCLVGLAVLVGAVNQSVLPPPVELGSGGACNANVERREFNFTGNCH